MRIVQYRDEQGSRRVGVVGEDGQSVRPVRGAGRLYDLALKAADSGKALEEVIGAAGLEAEIDYAPIADQGRLLVPLDHPDPAHLLLTGTGLTHLGSAQSRNAMHAKLEGDESELTDSMKIFKKGLAGGKPEPGTIGFQPEWFYKGDGSHLAAPGQPLTSPSWAQDGGEEAEIVGLYVVNGRGQVCRVGFALANEFSDHVMERGNYLNLSHSKMRQSSFGPELLTGELPQDIRGRVRILRGGEEIWSGELLSGEANMSHAISNLEHHHFKYPVFRRPGDAHCHFFGTGLLSFSDGVSAQEGDVFEISASEFGRPLANPLKIAGDQGLITVKVL